MNTRVSTHALRKAHYVVREMSRYYFPLYDLRLEDAFPIMSSLTICEAIVFEADIDLETNQAGLSLRVLASRNQIAEHLREEGVLDRPIERELDNLVEYAHLERRLVSASRPSAEDTERACALRTSDLRLLHRVLVRKLGLPYDESYFELAWPLEAIMDIELDLEDYARDRAQGGFNTLIMLERRLGAEWAAVELECLLKSYELLFSARLAAATPQTRVRFLEMLGRYQSDHPRPRLPGPEPVLELAEPRLL